jgi:hypothetical protein
MADADYRNEVGISQSMLKPMFVSPEHYKHQFTEQREVTKPMLIGTATHLACFQPSLFDKEVVVSKKFDLRKTQDKLDSAKFHEENAGKIIINDEEFDLIASMADKVREHPIFMDVTSKGDAEVSVFSDVLPYKDIKLKGRMDWVNWEKGIILDLKTTNANLSNMYEVKNVILDNLYAIQNAMYMLLLEHNGIENLRFIFIMVEKNPPHGVRCFEISVNSLKKAREKMLIAIAQIQYCVDHEIWAGYEIESTIIDV